VTGLCGVLGPREHDPDLLADDLRWLGHEVSRSVDDDRVAVRSAVHPAPDRAVPATTPDGTQVWVDGDVWGAETPDGYRRRLDTDATVAEFVADEYARAGTDCFAGLNGTFVAVVVDPVDGVHLVTDRLGTHPMFVARDPAGAVVFSTQIGSLAAWPGAVSGFTTDFVAEYLTLGSVGGVETPLAGVSELPPSSVTTVDPADPGLGSTSYWRPRYRPLGLSYDYFADEFRERFAAAVADRVDPDRTYGVLLSGGSDSRAVLAALPDDVDVRTYHTTGWEGRETRAAAGVAAAADRPFEPLWREPDDYQRLLETTPAGMNYLGRFNEAHLAAFAPRLRSEVDVLVSGLGADTLFREHAFRVPSVDLGVLGQVDLPWIDRERSVGAFLDRRTRATPAYLDTATSLRTVLGRHVTGGGRIDHHGVPCRTVDELVFFDDFYPFSNKSDYFFHALNRTAPHWSPFFDNRLLDLALRVPLRHRVRRNLIDTVTERLSPTLAAVPHAKTGVSLSASFPRKYLSMYANNFVWKFLSDDQPSEPHQNHGPWPDMPELLRVGGFAEETFTDCRPLVESLPFLDWDGVNQCYRDHCDGADNTFVLYTLLSFLRMPATTRVAGEP
jgi:asparagine synthase (glutamine-hydrolysing)